MRNWKLSKKLTIGIALIVFMGMILLYMTANTTLRKSIQEAENSNMEHMLNAQTSLIEEYIARQECLLTAYSKAPVVREFLKDVENQEKKK